MLDAKLIAYQLHEFANAMLTGGSVEVDGWWGLRDVAALYAVLESAVAGRSVTMEEVESGTAYRYQGAIDAALGID